MKKITKEALKNMLSKKKRLGYADRRSKRPSCRCRTKTCDDWEMGKWKP